MEMVESKGLHKKSVTRVVELRTASKLVTWVSGSLRAAVTENGNVGENRLRSKYDFAMLIFSQ